MVNLTNGSLVLSVALSLVVVPLVSFLKRDHWPQALNFVIALVASLMGGLLTTFVANPIHSWKDLLATGAVTLAAATTLFHTYFNGSALDSYLTKFGSVAKDVNTVAQTVEQVADATGNKQVTGYAKQVAALVNQVAADTTVAPAQTEAPAAT